jgi:hypothetical protein
MTTGERSAESCEEAGTERAGEDAMAAGGLAEAAGDAMGAGEAGIVPVLESPGALKATAVTTAAAQARQPPKIHGSRSTSRAMA